ncbi:MAG: segregation/condensation protein A [Bdellovibrionales bacterium]|nr:segregation/condensation protein A [Bdellovibrionales bacterium]
MEEYSHFFEVNLDLFDGPIDLLLHLVKLRELPIEKISLAQVADQYLSCIENAQGFDLEIAGEYLVIAATLLSIKSSMLLGEPVEQVIDDEGNLVDPHAQLLLMLREAEVYKISALELDGRALLGKDVFANTAALRYVKPGPVVFDEHDPFLLAKAFKKLLAGAKEDPTLQISFDPVSIVQRMMVVLNKLQECGGSLAFHQLVPDVLNRSSIIGTFIALLELCKRQVIGVQQAENDEITVQLLSVDNNLIGLAGLDSECDQDRPAIVNA